MPHKNKSGFGHSCPHYIDTHINILSEKATGTHSLKNECTPTRSNSNMHKSISALENKCWFYCQTPILRDQQLCCIISFPFSRFTETEIIQYFPLLSELLDQASSEGLQPNTFGACKSNKYFSSVFLRV